MLSYQPGKTRLAWPEDTELLEDKTDKLPEMHSLRLDALEKQAILKAIALKKGNIKKAAEALGVSRTTLYNKAKKYGIEL